MNYRHVLDQILSEAAVSSYESAVAVVKCRDKYLLGLSTANDDRHLRWCFPGGRIKRGESPQKAAERETKEETGIRCNATDNIHDLKDKPKVAFVICSASTISQALRKNHEFIALGWFRESELQNLRLHANVKQLIKIAKGQ